jgi:hypothetical protein
MLPPSLLYREPPASAKARLQGRRQNPRGPRMVKKLEWIEMAQLAVSSILFKSFSLELL